MSFNKTICFLNTVRSWGGGEKWHLEMATQLHRRGYQVLVIAHPDSVLAARLSETGIPVIHAAIGNLSFLNPYRLLALSLTFRRHHIDTLIINFPPDLKAGGIAARLAGVRRIVYRRGSAIPVRNTFLNRALFKSVLTDVIANSEATRETILQNNPALFPRDKIKVLYNGIDIADAPGPRYPRGAGTPNGGVVLGCVGRLAPQKGHELLLDIARSLKERGIRFRLSIAGGGPLEEQLRRHIKDMQLEDHVFLAGFIDDITAFMDTIDVLLLPSRWEGFGFVVVEAMSRRKPVIAWNISSNPELIEHGGNGYLATPFDIDEFAGYVVELSNDPDKAAAMGSRGRDIACARFTLQKSIDEFVAFLDP